MPSYIDVGVVLLPDQKTIDSLNNYKNHIRQSLKEYSVKNNLPPFQELLSNFHVTLYHAADGIEIINPQGENTLEQIDLVKFELMKQQLVKFVKNHPNTKLFIEVVKLVATGKRWVDVDVKNSNDQQQSLQKLHFAAVDDFSQFHKPNSQLARMADDDATRNAVQKAQIIQHGTTVDPYNPHFTAWYLNLPTVEKQNEFLNTIPLTFNEIKPSDEMVLESIALVKLGRNGNAEEILFEVPLNYTGATELFGDIG